MHRMTTPHQTPLFDEKAVRVTVPVPPHVLEAFRELAAVQGVSVGKAMGEWLTDTLDGVNAMVQLLAKAKRAPHLAVRQLSGYAMGLSELTSELLEEVRRDSKAGKVAGGGPASVPAKRGGGGAATGRPAVRKRTPTPPVGNTGGKVPQDTTKRPTTGGQKTKKGKA
jgi:hypothetical protein